jgi:hypothetical protein
MPPMKRDMNIQPVSNNSPLPEVRTAASRGKKASPESPEFLVDGKLTGLNGALETIPAIRPDVIARGRALAADPNYPGPVVLDQLAGIFASDALK